MLHLGWYNKRYTERNMFTVAVVYLVYTFVCQYEHVGADV